MPDACKTARFDHDEVDVEFARLVDDCARHIAVVCHPHRCGVEAKGAGELGPALGQLPRLLLGAVVDVGGITRDRRHRAAEPCGMNCRHRHRLPYGEHDGFGVKPASSSPAVAIAASALSEPSYPISIFMDPPS